MFVRYFTKRKLVSCVKELAIYNDKGMHWRSHDTAQITAERKRLICLIQIQLDKLENCDSLKQLQQAIETGALAIDDEGKYIDIAKSV
ncbi:hypothetical protein [Colwellia piezophila]|uniref:hypothetical protein n=1 Tax=Colwellia piezophila TaxID=211668 RepID=UPI000374B73B|nr:hypothetical protein [Colwellia piezophila]